MGAEPPGPRIRRAQGPVEQIPSRQKVSPHEQCQPEPAQGVWSVEVSVSKPSGSLKHFLHQCKGLTSDPWVLNAVQGYEIEFGIEPIQISVPKPIQFSVDEQVLVDNEVRDMILKGAVEPCTHEHGKFIYNIFLVQKKNGKFRPVINLRDLNDCIEYHHFKQETLEVILQSVQRNDFFTSVDLKDAYFSVPIAEHHRKFLRFQWRGILYEFCALPFGIYSLCTCGAAVAEWLRCPTL
ncbi:hypothetical protein CI610_03154 [invertebrate metagenome]|uniref:Reverse transcriptase domain-containing protein n=1 Tax=invertebrate metagenome TaxID=1711999 RepID=A0A2H9T3Z9_9ZZZZ